MINLFVQNNRMTQWQVSKKTKKLRENCVKQSYSDMKELLDKGGLEHIKIPKPALQEAKERKSTNKYSFEGIINGGMKSYKLEELDALSNNNSIRYGAMDGTFNINPMNATGGFSEATNLYGGGQEFVDMPMTPNTVGGGGREPTTSHLQSLAKSMGDGSKIKTPASNREQQEVVTETAIRS